MNLKGWRTLLVAIIVAVIGAVEVFDWAQIIPEQYVGVAMVVIGFVMGILRKLTNTALGESE